MLIDTRHFYDHMKQKTQRSYYTSSLNVLLSTNRAKRSHIKSKPLIFCNIQCCCCTIMDAYIKHNLSSNNEVSICTSNPCEPKTQPSYCFKTDVSSYCWLCMMSLRVKLYVLQSSPAHSFWREHRSPSYCCSNLLFVRSSQSGGLAFGVILL